MLRAGSQHRNGHGKVNGNGHGKVNGNGHGKVNGNGNGKVNGNGNGKVNYKEQHPSAEQLSPSTCDTPIHDQVQIQNRSLSISSKLIAIPTPQP